MMEIVGVATYPREGTETLNWKSVITSCIGCKLSPRGDGNQTAPNLISFIMVATYPREGTETRMPQYYKCPRPTLQLIPARGRKLDIIQADHALTSGCKLSPGGDGNFHILRDARLYNRCNLSPRGDGNTPALRHLVDGHTLQLIPARGQKPLVIKEQNRI